MTSSKKPKIRAIVATSNQCTLGTLVRFLCVLKGSTVYAGDAVKQHIVPEREMGIITGCALKRSNDFRTKRDYLEITVELTPNAWAERLFQLGNEILCPNVGWDLNNQWSTLLPNSGKIDAKNATNITVFIQRHDNTEIDCVLTF